MKTQRENCLPKEFSELRDIATDAVFIIASGQSAKGFPVERFADVPMITMNGAISLFVDTDIAPFFYACTDTDFPRQQPALFAEALKRSERLAIWRDHVPDLPAEALGKVVPLEKVRPPTLLSAFLNTEESLVRGGPFWSKRARSIGFSKDLSQGFFDARTVAYLALQIAYHVGFKTVILVGVDLDESSGRFYEGGKGHVSPCGLDEHFATRILPSLQVMAEHVVGQRFRVYNLSPVSRIPEELIPKITLDDVDALIGASSG